MNSDYHYVVVISVAKRSDCHYVLPHSFFTVYIYYYFAWLQDHPTDTIHTMHIHIRLY